MKKYRVSIQITQIDESKGHYLDLGPPYEAGTFKTEIAARELVENELMIIRPADAKLQQSCQQVLDSLDVGGELSRAFADEIQMLKDALNTAPTINNCPKSEANTNEQELKDMDPSDVDAMKVWVLAVTDRGFIVHTKAFCSKQEAEKALFEYLRCYENYDGPDDITKVCDWLAEHNERLSVDLCSTPVNPS
ncbi:MAG: hypothetical protein ACXABY_34745 [Candidatus Thorarchaeota archaeon]|jgi:hypothetical protein